MLLTTRGLVLREAKYQESDKILTVLTESEGKLTVRVRWAARPSSRYAAAVQLLCFSELTLFGNKGRWSLNEAEALEQFLGLREDVGRFALGAYIAELLEWVSDEDSPGREPLRLGLNCLYALSRGLRETGHIKAVFELRLACVSGYKPRLDSCAICGSPEPPEPVLNLEEGTICCASCVEFGARTASVRLCAASLAAMRYIASAPPRRELGFSLEPEAARRLGLATERYLTARLEREPRTLDFYRKLGIEVGF